jgi:hypothetical protein
MKNTSKEKLINAQNYKRSLIYNNNTRRINYLNDRFNIMRFTNDDQVDKKELNSVPYTQALRIDHRNYIQMLISVLVHEIDIIDIFYYKNPFKHLSISLSIYIFELCLDLTLNCLLYTDDVVSQKYNNNGNIKFLTSLSLSFMSNIFASIISFIVGKLANYAEIFDFIIKDVILKREYFLSIIKFKKYIMLKLIVFYLVQLIVNSCMCYYLMIFCTIYHKTQGSILMNYAMGIAESMVISFGLTIIISLLRYLSLTYRWKSIYNTSKYLFENF